MSDNPLAHVPDPSKRYQVMAISRGPLVFVEIADRETGATFVCDALDALEIAADITSEVVRALRELGDKEVDSLSATDRLRWLDEEGENLQRDIWRRKQN